jgi:hypothetical protein
MRAAKLKRKLVDERGQAKSSHFIIETLLLEHPSHPAVKTPDMNFQALFKNPL